MKQKSFFKADLSRHRYSHGGLLRNQRKGRKARSLSTKNPLHLVFKCNRIALRGSFRSPRQFSLVHHLLRKYSRRFYVKVEQISVQGDHLHLLVRTTRRSLYQNFFRVIAGQIAQVFESEGLLTRAMRIVTSTKNKTVTDTPHGGQVRQGKPFTKPRSEIRLKLWKYRPFTRVVLGTRARKIIRDYIQLNEKEARSEIPYRKERLRGLTDKEWKILWE